MKERPILMSAPMVRAILAGKKTQTRRVVKPAPQMVTDRKTAPWDGDATALLGLLSQAGRPCPYGQPGDRLWVREAHCFCPRSPSMEKWSHTPEEARVVYGADDLMLTGPYGLWRPKMRPSIHMPRWASRITLEVTGVRVERLQDISEADSVAEGVTKLPGGAMWTAGGIFDGPLHGARPEWAYRRLWESINGPGSWDANPWVWCVEFRRIT